MYQHLKAHIRFMHAFFRCCTLISSWDSSLILGCTDTTIITVILYTTNLHRLEVEMFRQTLLWLFLNRSYGRFFINITLYTVLFFFSAAVHDIWHCQLVWGLMLWYSTLHQCVISGIAVPINSSCCSHCDSYCIYRFHWGNRFKFMYCFFFFTNTFLYPRMLHCFWRGES